MNLMLQGHFAVHSGPEGLRHEFNAEVNKKDLYETYLPAFKACIDEADVESVMGAYNRVNGEPCCGSKTLLKDILRGEWGWGYDCVCRSIIQNQERDINKIKYNLSLNNCEIEFIKLFCTFIKDNNDKNTIKIGGTCVVDDFSNIIAYLKDKDINIEIINVFYGKGDHDPYIVFKINSYSDEKINYILNTLI